MTNSLGRFHSGFVRSRARPVKRLRGRNTPSDADYIIRPLSSPGDETGSGAIPCGAGVRAYFTVDHVPGTGQISNRDTLSLTLFAPGGASHVALYWGESDVLIAVGELQASWDRGSGGYRSLCFGPGQLEMTMS